MTKSYIPVVNAPIRTDILEGENQTTTELESHLKRDRHIGSRDKVLVNEKEHKLIIVNPRKQSYLLKETLNMTEKISGA